MSELPVDLYLYTAEADNVLLGAKRSLELDLSIELPGMRVTRISCPRAPRPPAPLTVTYSPEQGFLPAMPLSEDRRQTLELMQGQLSWLLLMRTNTELMIKEVMGTFSPAQLLQKEVPEAHFRKYFIFMREERKVIVDRIREFYKWFETTMASTSNPSEARSLYQKVEENFQLGVYSATNQERKGLRAG